MSPPRAQPPATTRTLYLIRRLDLEVRLRLEEVLREFELSPSLYLLLGVVARRPGQSAADLARRLLMTPQSMKELVELLERRALILREPDPLNRRILRITATSTGAALLARCDRAVDGVEAEAFAPLNPRDQQAFRLMLNLVIERLRDHRTGGPPNRAEDDAATPVRARR